MSPVEENRTRTQMVNIQVIGSQQEMLGMLWTGSSTLHRTKCKDLGETSRTSDVWKLMMCSKAVRQITWGYSGPGGAWMRQRDGARLCHKENLKSIDCFCQGTFCYHF